MYSRDVSFPGLRYQSEYTTALAPAPFASNCLWRSFELHYAWVTTLCALPLLGFLLLDRRRVRARARIRDGHCPRCNYDLRAHRKGDACPECGCVIPASGSSIAARRVDRPGTN